MVYNSSSGSVNKEVLVDDLGLKQDRNTVFFEHEDFIVLSPSIQNDSWWFDLLRGNVEKVRISSKDGLLILRLLDKLLITPLKKFMENMVLEEHVVIRQQGSDNWKFYIKQDENGFYVINQKNSKRHYSVKEVTKEELKQLVKQQIWSSYTDEENSLRNNDSEVPSNDFQISHFYNYITSKGFLYSEENIKNLYLSLRSKPFVILSGISGTGKTKIVQLFAEAVGATEENGQFKLIPVRPDWSDSSDLIGYKDIKNEFIKGPLIEVIIEASQNLDRPYFVVLDEMNLARVEYYLSDFLSVVESRGWKDGAIETAPIVEFIDENGELQKYGLPENLYIIGTVNMDETTHPFSKKVLDRANSIEFNEVHLTSFHMFDGSLETMEAKQASNALFKSDYLFLKDVYMEHEELVQKISNQLETINEHLAKNYAQVGYRVRDEIAFYMAYNEELDLLTDDEAMDFCIMQKILPRLTGAGDEIREVLIALLKDFINEPIDDKTDFKQYELPKKQTAYPKSAKKVLEMLARLSTQGFVSYWNV